MERYVLQKKIETFGDYFVLQTRFSLVLNFQIMEVDKSGPITVLVQVLFGFKVFSAETIK